MRIEQIEFFKLGIKCFVPFSDLDASLALVFVPVDASRE